MRASNRGPALFGRNPELAAAKAALTDVLAESARLVLVTGEAGIGKTRLLDEMARVAKDVGIPVVRGAWLETEGVPAFWAWRQLLQRAGVFGESARELTPSEHAAISRLAPDAPWLELPKPRQSIAEESREERFIAFQAMTRLLTVAAISRPRRPSRRPPLGGRAIAQTARARGAGAWIGSRPAGRRLS